MVKLMENTTRDVNIAIANEFRAPRRKVRCGCLEAIRLANLHPRINILSPDQGLAVTASVWTPGSLWRPRPNCRR